MVHRALDEQSGQVVAVKLLHADTASPYILEHFVREAEILATIQHPHIVSYVAHGTDESGRAFLAMEWLDGYDLAHRLQRGPLSLREAIQLVSAVASALKTTHAQQVVHRDLKPSNLYLPSGDIGRVKVLDFGIARRFLGSRRALTQTGVVVGTPEYMAPEQVRGERSVAAAADIFALGCVLYECLAGVPPFTGEQVVAVLAQILFESPPDLRQHRPNLPPTILELLPRMLAKSAAPLGCA